MLELDFNTVQYAPLDEFVILSAMTDIDTNGYSNIYITNNRFNQITQQMFFMQM